MTNQASGSIFSSLRNRILLAVAALVVFNSIFGLLGYLAVSFVISEPIYAVIAAVAAMTAATAGFGWWLSNEILRPIEALSLLAHSLERSPSASLPKTTGASETDQLLTSLHRNSQQLQNLIALMDDVANGKTDAAMAPLRNPDRLSLSFQKLVSKVVESIKAKQQLDALQNSVNRLKNDVSSIRSGDLSIVFRGELWQVGEIADVIRYLAENFSEIIRHASASASSAKNSAEDARKSLRSVVDAQKGQSERMKKTAAALSDSAPRLAELTMQLESAVSDAASSIQSRSSASDESLSRLRTLAGESRKQLEQLRERANAISPAARRTDEIARRAKIIALNASVQGSVQQDSILADEVASLALRAEAVHKEVLTINEFLISDLAQVDASLAAISSEIPNITCAAAQQAELIGEIEKNMGRIDALASALKSYAGERSISDEAAAKTILSQFQGIDVEEHLKQADTELETILRSVETLRDAVSPFRSPSAALPEQRPAGAGSHAAATELI